MIIREFFKTRNDSVDLYITYSDNGVKINKVGTDVIYDDAVDVEGASFTYEETDVPIDSDESKIT